MRNVFTRFLILSMAIFSIPAASFGQNQDIEKKRLEDIKRMADQRAIMADLLKAQEARVAEVQQLRDLATSQMVMRSSLARLSSRPDMLIQNTQVRKELELDQDQIGELAKIQENYQQQMQSELKRAHDGNAFDHKKWKSAMNRVNDQRTSAMKAVLLPHQSKRLKQIAVQMELKNKGQTKAIVGDNLANELGIDDAQKKRLESRAAEIKTELEEKIAKLKKQAEREFLEELSPQQRRKLDELTGDKFEIKPARRK